jgi:hypothetical protein
MTLATLALLAVMMPFTSQSPPVEPDPLSTYRWTHRLLVLHVPDTKQGRATLAAFRTALDDQMTDVLDRDLLIVPVGDLPHAGNVLRLAVHLDALERLAVRRRLGLHGPIAQLVLIGKDGGVKTRQSGAVDLPGLFALIDSMPMRRVEAQRR